MPRLCVFAGSSAGGNPRYRTAATALGTVMGQRGVGLVYGGAQVGLMGAVADAVLAAGGEVVGVLPAMFETAELAHRGLTALHVVDGLHARKAMMADLADAFVALPGGFGTLDELFEILTWAQLGLHDKRIIGFNVAGYFDRFLALIEHAIDEGFVRRDHRRLLAIESDPEAILRHLVSG